MNVLVVGSGAREHALAWKIRSSPYCHQLFLWPGNAASMRLGQDMGLAIDASHGDVARRCQELHIKLVVIGPEKPLSDGLADTLTQADIAVFGPNRAAARLESSKAFAKQMMTEAGIPTASFRVARDHDECATIANTILAGHGGVVLKACGLAAGKGVFVCRAQSELNEGLERLYSASMQQAASTVVIEELLEGRESSFFVFLGPDVCHPIGFAVDYKRLRDGDQGPNTGGMGGYTPVPWLPKEAELQIMERVVHPLRAALAKHNITYTGCLYVGLMWTVAGPKVIEFNVRLGDPEAQILAMADHRDWLPLMAEAAGRLLPASQTQNNRQWQPTAGIVLASNDYPWGEIPLTRGRIPSSLVTAEPGADCACFGAALRAADADMFETGAGRVMTIVASGDTLSLARQRAYTYSGIITSLWRDAQWRRDIALVGINDITMENTP